MIPERKKYALPALVLFLLLCFLAGWVGSQFQPGDWYDQLAKPAIKPPAWLFGPVWTLLYILMAVAAWLVWMRGTPLKSNAPMALFLVQLALNAAWSWVFFGLHKPGLAFGEILLLMVALSGTLILFWRVRPLAGLLMLPYLLWVSFAALLNYFLWRLNI